MNKVLRHATVAMGLAIVAWVGAGYIQGHPLALVVTALIGASYLMGVFELHRFQQATAALALVLEDVAEPLPSLRPWLDRVPAPLQNAVRRRIEGEPVGLPGPAMAPSLAGLLVLLGMLGTFLGMVFTLRGTGLALESATDLVAVRNSLVEPVKGLGVAFGTSVAGVAASAALGLLTSLSRRERVQVAQRLDACIATTLRAFSVAHQRETSLALLQRQADLMPTLVDGLQTMMTAMARQAEDASARLLAEQARFHDKAEAVYQGLAVSMAQSLQASLVESARITGETIRPVAETTLAGMARETASLHTALAATMQGQLDQLATRFDTSTAAVAEAWHTLLARHEDTGQALIGSLQTSHQRFADTFEHQSAALLRTVAQGHAEQQSALALNEQQRADAMAQSLQAVARDLQSEWQVLGAQTLAQQQRVCDAVERAANGTSAEISRLVQAAAEAPRAAAEVITELRQKLSDSMARDTSLLDERARMLDTLGTLLDGVNQAATEQRGAIDALVASSATALARVGERFSEQIDAQVGKLAEVGAQVTGSAAEVAGLGEAFGAAVQLFSESNDKLGAHLQRIDEALNASMSRSDEQLAYYVAQAREVVDLSILSQKQILDNLQRLGGKTAPAGALG